MSHLRKGIGPDELKLKGRMPKGHGAVSPVAWLAGE